MKALSMKTLKAYKKQAMDALPDAPDIGDVEAARGLGIASIGIGLTEILAPRQVERMMGLETDSLNTGVLRTLGVREIMHGIDILSHKDPTPGVWSRVAGDVLDGVVMSIAATKTKKPGGFAAVTAMVLGIVALDAIFAGRLTRGR